MPNRRPPPRPGNHSSRPGPKSGGPARRPPQRRAENQAAAPRPTSQRDRDRDRQRERPRDAEGDGLERLQKVLAHAGVSSRRACEDLIRQGRITVDGQTVRELGTKVDPKKQQVAVDGQKVHSERNVYYAVHKPKGYVCTNSDPAGKPLVINLLPEIPQRAYAVGRLDEQSTGLMLLTNDGELANKLAHPKFGVEKVYRVVCAGEPGREILDQLTQGIWLAEGKVRAKRVKVTGRKGQATILEMVLAEGKNREIRRMLAKLGHKVMSLTRIAVGPIGLKGLGVGEARPLTGAEVDILRKVAAGLILPTPSYPDRRDRTPRPEGARRPSRPPAAAGAGDRSDRRPERPRPEGRFPAGGDRPRPAQGQGQGQGRPPRPYTNQGARPAQGQRDGQGQGPPGRPPRPPYGQGPRLAEGQGQGQEPRQNQGTGQTRGPERRPPSNRSHGPASTQGQGHGPGAGSAERRPPRPTNSGPGRPSGHGPESRPPRPTNSGPGRPSGHGPESRPPRPTNSGPGPGARRPSPPSPRGDDGPPPRRIIGLVPEPPSSRGGPTGPRLHRPGPKRSPRAAQGMKRPPRRPEGEGKDE